LSARKPFVESADVPPESQDLRPRQGKRAPSHITTTYVSVPGRSAVSQSVFYQFDGSRSAREDGAWLILAVRRVRKLGLPQCAGAIRLGRIGTVRFAGPDRYWDGCHDFGKLSAREARRIQPTRIGPRRDELGTFATLISRFGDLTPGYEEALRLLGEGPMVDLVHELRELTQALPAS
jgi:hypothetical protein